MKVSAATDSEIPLQSVESHWHRIFDQYDEDKDGVIPVRDLAAAVKSSAFAHDIPSHAVKKIIRKFDDNEDGFISYEEFIKLVESEEGQVIFNKWFHAYIKHTIPKRRRIPVTTTVIDGEYEEEYSCNPPAVGMLLISIIEIAIFTFDHTTKDGGYAEAPAAQIFIYNPHKKEESWRFLTYMFVHIGFFHLIVNLLVQILLGIPLEMVHSYWRVLIIYFCGVIAGSLGTSVSDPQVYLAGASGGVYAIIAAHLATIIMNWSEMTYPAVQLLVFILLAAVDIGNAIYTRYVLNMTVQIGYVAHLTGALAGLLVGLYLLRNLQVHSWEKTLAWSALILYFILTAAAVLWNVFY